MENEGVEGVNGVRVGAVGYGNVCVCLHKGRNWGVGWAGVGVCVGEMAGGGWERGKSEWGIG